MEDRICEEEISGGNSWEAASRWLNSFSSKPTANLIASEALVSLTILHFLALGRIGRFADTKGDLFSLRSSFSLGRLEAEGRIGRKVGTAAGIKSIKEGETSNIKWCSLSLRRAEGMISHKVGTDTDIELR